MEMPLVTNPFPMPKETLTSDTPARILIKAGKSLAFEQGIIDQQSADLAILRAERLEEAEWLAIQVENWHKGWADTIDVIGAIEAHIASLKGEGEGDSKGGTPASP